jgi:2-polyprenyl-3-methyl-5-hydroxy-6-metoxy-1,4-benzoquinol methylase
LNNLKARCNLCFSENVAELGKIGSKPVSVTSDSKLCAMQARVFICRHCGHFQKLCHNRKENVAVNSIYENYAPHFLSRGNEQLLFPEDSQPQPRTLHVLQKCLRFFPKTGRLLDIGTGNGPVLRSASKLLPNWRLHAFDISDSYKDEVLRIPNVEKFFSGTLDNLSSAKYDLIVLWHALEHIPEPVEMLRRLKSRLTKDGFLLLQAPDIERNPFDFAVIDHYSHFSLKRLAGLFSSFGFEIAAKGSKWTHNCLTLLLKRSPSSAAVTACSFGAGDIESESYFYWVNKTLEHFRRSVNGSDYAVFGTGMASLWVYRQMSRKALFFVDEDGLRAGNRIDGVSIITPEDVMIPALNLLMPFIHPTGLKISQKLQVRYLNLKSCNFVFTPVLREEGGRYGS